MSSACVSLSPVGYNHISLHGMCPSGLKDNIMAKEHTYSTVTATDGRERMLAVTDTMPTGAQVIRAVYTALKSLVISGTDYVLESPMVRKVSKSWGHIQVRLVKGDGTAYTVCHMDSADDAMFQRASANDGWTCGCPDFLFRRKFASDCKHISAVKGAIKSGEIRVDRVPANL